jgi:Mn2+/Fe2+ NRAMP family transporter
MHFTWNYILPFVAFVLLTVVSVLNIMDYRRRLAQQVNLTWWLNGVLPLVAWTWLIFNATAMIHCFRDMTLNWW